MEPGSSPEQVQPSPERSGGFLGRVRSTAEAVRVKAAQGREAFAQRLSSVREIGRRFLEAGSYGETRPQESQKLPDFIPEPPPTVVSEAYELPRSTTAMPIEKGVANLVPPPATDTREMIAPTTQEITTEQVSSPEQSLEVEGENRGIHPDIEAGITAILNDQLPRFVELGIMTGITSSGRQFQEMTAAGGIEMTEQGQTELREKITQVIDEGLSNGLTSTLEAGVWWVGRGVPRTSSIDDTRKRIGEIFEVSRQTGVEVQFTPRSQEESPTLPVPTLTTEVEVRAYFEDMIDRNLPTGIKSKIDTLAYTIGGGTLKGNTLAEFDEGIDAWVELMKERGFEVIDDETQIAITKGEAIPGLLVRRVNKAEIRQLRDESIKANLAKGVQETIDMVAYQVKNGAPGPLQWVSADKMAAYQELGEQFGVINLDAPTLVEGQSFNPQLVSGEVQRVVTEGFQEGFDKLLAGGSYWLQQGDANMVAANHRWVAEYIEMAKALNIPVDVDAATQKMQAQITPNGVQQGIEVLIAKVKESVRKGGLYLVGVEARKVDDLRRLVHDNGWDGQVDFSKFDTYLDQVGVKRPQLSS